MPFEAIRRKFYLACVSSAILSGACGYLLLRLLRFMTRPSGMAGESLPARSAAWIVNHVGAKPALLMACAALFLCFFHWRSGKLREEYEACLPAAERLPEEALLRSSLLEAEKQLADIRWRMQRWERRNGERADSSDAPDERRS
ncbi:MULTISPECIES: hypothetical protein [unclassified Paenibacillus]|uniref:hypothetical protein n=1 Tax=unclassified Paenibacillus TaxID=185978 RepID=UPI000954759C|nr:MULTISPECIES: hypothetical protein [unclassified Paenibacillus]ASS66458.1 hypothetical protein CIC07_10050 [Paenibacillus sp. RUD330]SIQ03756.1 hypothetical protein SAMN05880555_0409 [Paenibacillus sp. RU4X]SIQ23611.1 hypothetical protein SAMN05880570_0409 [Paenibacillus sp. RU4T]